MVFAFKTSKTQNARWRKMRLSLSQILNRLGIHSQNRKLTQSNETFTPKQPDANPQENRKQLTFGSIKIMW